MAEARIITHWNEYLAEFPPARADIYFSEEYICLYKYQGYGAECFLYEEAGDIFLFPYLRAMPANHQAPHDITTAYGYGGPIANRPSRAFCENAWRAMLETLAASGARSVLIRFHPMIANHELVPRSVTVQRVRTVVAVDLLPSVRDIWTMQLDSNRRNMVRKAESHELAFVVDKDFEHLDDFVAVYRKTMESLGADPAYFFSDAYFRAFHCTLSDKSALFVVTKDCQVVAGALFMFSGPYAHYHLSGSLRESLHMRPNDLLVYGAALEARKREARLLHLGGGRSDAADDGLLKFKRGFGGMSYDYYTSEIALR